MFRSLKKASKVFGFEKLVVWQKSIDLADTIYEVTKSFPRKKSHILLPQLLRSSNSIPANIAEGSFRRSKKEFIQFLYIAKGSLGETITYLELALRQRYMDKSVYEDLISRSKEVLTLLVALIKSFDKRPLN